MLLFLFCFPMSMAGAAPATTIESYDVIVFGSEIQGMLLAQEARTLGLNVLVLDPRSRPGGELIQGQMFFLDDVNDNRKNSLVQGEIKHLFDGYKAGTIRKADEFQQYYDRIAKGIPLKSSIVIESVNISANNGMKSLKTLTYRDKAGVRHTVQAKYWVENSDFSGLTGKLGEKRIPGMESLYNSKKPDYMAATYMLNFKKVNWSKLHQAILEDYPLTHVRAKYGPNTYVDWHFATGFSNLTQNFATNDPQLRLRGLNAVYQRDGQVIINALLIYNVDPSNPALIKSALRKGRAQAPQILAFLRKNIPGFSNAELNGYPEYLYIRDYNRYQTKYVLDYPDLTSGKMFWDNVSIGGYSIDLQGTSAIPTGIGFGKPNRYGIPLRSFELRSYDNVLVIGKNIGATIKAYGSARIMPTNALAAQTIGIILGRERNKQLDELTESDFKRIHSYLKKDYHIVLK
ncbi:FAD-dependent oxidoreductase [Paenibacillus sophorae]|nr:FAD-dependent oxidoreductase [Paenibacillus sophorae]